MRAFAVVVVALSLAATAEARPAKKKRVAIDAPAPRERVAPVAKALRDRSIGAPWSGRLQAPAKLKGGDGYVIRRPLRAFGTRTTVELVKDAVTNTLEAFPKTHVLAIGDISAERGGWITEHASHQSGRDVDLGLFYKKKPAGYPRSFVRATKANLDPAATWKLVWELAKTSTQDGGAQIIFLDYEVQGIIYRWAKEHDVSAKRLSRVFQYPNGRYSATGIVRHFANHDNHLHVRFKCRDRDTQCR
ncbi:MAG: penicillin-insensitive murein endopeptidase [Myxococcales bacterium]|nr:penicillin-insensitive murein endopeptidase [Myxococcales bacterium]